MSWEGVALYEAGKPRVIGMVRVLQGLYSSMWLEDVSWASILPCK